MTDNGYEVTIIQTTIPALQPWAARTVKALEVAPDGYAEVSFEPDGIRTTCIDGSGSRISEETIPRDRLGSFEQIYAYEPRTFAPRLLRFWDIMDLHCWLDMYDHSPVNNLTVCMESDKGDIGIQLAGCQRLMKFFGVHSAQLEA